MAGQARADRKVIKRVILAFLLCWVVSLEGAIVKGPYVQNVTQRAATICFVTDDEKASVQIGVNAESLTNVTLTAEEIRFSVKTEQGTQQQRTNYLQKARVKDLSPGNSYCYRVFSTPDVSELFRFQTIPEKADAFIFLVYGDTRDNPGIHKQIVRRILSYAPAFVLHSGDFVDSGSNYRQWGEDFFAPAQPLISGICLWPARGNHEANPSLYRKFFDLPEKEFWYSFDYGNAHFVCLDSEAQGELEDAMFAWLQKDLADTKALWRIVFYHRPTYNVGGHRSRWGRDRFLPLFHKHKVDLVFTGHSHLYERFFPLAPLEAKGIYPIVHITTGGGGAPLAGLRPHPYLASSSATYHFCMLHVSSNRMEMSAVDVAGKTIDNMVLEKSDGQYSEKYLKNIRSEEMINTYVDLLHLLRANLKLPQFPTREKPCEILLPITNQHLEELRLSFEVARDPLYWEVAPLKQEVVLKKGEKAEIHFKVANLRLEKKLPQITLNVTWHGSLGEGEPLAWPVTYAPPKAGPSK